MATDPTGDLPNAFESDSKILAILCCYFWNLPGLHWFPDEMVTLASSAPSDSPVHVQIQAPNFLLPRSGLLMANSAGLRPFPSDLEFLFVFSVFTEP